MKLERRHLSIAILILVGAVGYNIYSFKIRARARVPQQGVAPLLANAATVRAAAPAQPTFDATTIPAPPSVDLSRSPRWSRDPLLAPGESRRPHVVPAVSQAVEPDPSLQTILYSPERRLAIVDNRIVRVGDLVSIGTIVEIGPDAIVVQTRSGERRRVELHRGPTLQERRR